MTVELHRLTSCCSRLSKYRKIDDVDLDSGDDEGRDNGVDTDTDIDRDDADVLQFEEQILDVEIGRHAAPSPSDGEVRFNACII